MKFLVKRENLLKPLQLISGIVERKQTLPILANVLLKFDGNCLALTATDLEIEITAKTEIENEGKKDITVQLRKLLDICRALPEGVDIELNCESEKLCIKSNKSRFILATLPAENFPSIESIKDPFEFCIPQAGFKKMLENTCFSMANQDVRYYLNGLLLEIDEDVLRAVATDGHRLAYSEMTTKTGASKKNQIIVPRKGVLELSRLLDDSEDEIKMSIGTNHIRAEFADLTFISKLVDGRFPDFEKVLPKNAEKILYADRNELKQTLIRTSILSNEKYRGIRISIKNGLLKATANNHELEEAEEEMEVDYTNDDIEVGFNVNYVIDVLSVIKSPQVKLCFTDSNSSCLVLPRDDADSKYVIMPMRL